MQLPVILTLRPSRRLALLLLAAHGGALVVLLLINLPVWIRLGSLLAVFYSVGLAWQRIYGRGRIVRLLLRADGKMELTRLNGESSEATQHPHTTVTPQLTILLLKFGQRLEALVLLVDSLNAKEFRQLRLWLRWLATISPNGRIGT